MTLFSQVLSLNVPEGFVHAGVRMANNSKAWLFVPGSENLQQWSQLVSVSGQQDLTGDPQVGINLLNNLTMVLLEGTCPKTYSRLVLGSFTVGAYSALAYVHGCGTVPGTTSKPYGEQHMVVTIRGAKDIYSVQWTERTAATPKPPEIDGALWRQRFIKLRPIRLCDPGVDVRNPSSNCL